MIEAFQHRARQMSEAMKFLGDDLPSHASAVALLAVHCAIAWNDVIQIRLTGKRAKYENHKHAVNHTRRICGSRGIDTDGVRHFEALLNSKNAVSYDETLILESAADKARSHAIPLRNLGAENVRRAIIMPQSVLRKPILTPAQRQGRAVNAVATLLRKLLRVPNIYLQVGWPRLNRRGFNVMAVDDGGAGDVHLVDVKLGPIKRYDSLLEEIKIDPAQFMYIASDDPALANLAHWPVLFAQNGIGRIGLISLRDVEGESPAADLLVRPERFQMPGKYAEMVNKFVRQLPPDIEIRI